MTDDDWWDEAVNEFGLDAYVVPISYTSPGVDVTQPVRRRRRSLGIDWLIIAVCALAAAFLLRVFVIQQFAVDGESMLGTLHSGDRVIVNKLSYHVHDPRHGDIVVLKDIKNALEERDLIKRVIALPGETIEYRDCQLFIDGQRITEPYLDPDVVSADRCGDSQAAVEVEANHVFVMGDNRAASLDSRTSAIGQIPYSHLIGRAFVVVWPKSDWGWL